jgi:hypothetical protein
MSEGNPLGFHNRWTRLKPPLRPDAEIVAAYRRTVAGHTGRVLLLGVTAELADIGDTLVAVDLSRKMIANAWPGDTDRRQAIHANWMDMPLKTREFTAVIGDGSLPGFRLAEYPALFARLGSVMLPGARFAVRIYEMPADGETVEQVRRAAMSGSIKGFHAFKWRLAMAIVADTKNATVVVSTIHEVFEREFPDRRALSTATGWSLEDIAEIDAYAGKPLQLNFLTRHEILSVLPDEFANPRFETSGTYELAERCPILVADFSP